VAREPRLANRGPRTERPMQRMPGTARQSRPRAPGTVHPTPCTSHRAPDTVHEPPCTRHRAPDAVRPTPCAIYRASVTARGSPAFIGGPRDRQPEAGRRRRAAQVGDAGGQRRRVIQAGDAGRRRGQGAQAGGAGRGRRRVTGSKQGRETRGRQSKEVAPPSIRPACRDQRRTRVTPSRRPRGSW